MVLLQQLSSALVAKSSHRQYRNEMGRLCSINFFFTKIGSGPNLTGGCSWLTPTLNEKTKLKKQL